MTAPSRLALALLAALALAAPAQAAHDATPRPVLHAVSGVRAFTLLASESAQHEFARTPSFAWKPTPGVARYEFELATSRSFAGNAMIWSDESLKSPAVAIPIALPWITGEPYSLY